MNAEVAYRAALTRGREVIGMHEAAARQHLGSAAVLEQQALLDQNDVLANRAMDAAGRARERAGLAAARAAAARERLRRLQSATQQNRSASGQRPPTGWSPT